MDDDVGERGPVEHAPCETESPGDAAGERPPRDPRSASDAELAIPRTVTLEGDGDAPTGGEPPAPPFDARARAIHEIQTHLQALKDAARFASKPGAAEELVQDTVERLLKTGIPSHVNSALGWMIKIMRNLYTDQCRAAARRPIHEPLEDAHLNAPYNVTHMTEDPQPAWEQVTLDDVKEALQELDPPYREVYVLHELEGWSYAEIATHIKFGTVTVGTRLTRARFRLRQILTRKVGRKEP